MQTGLPAAPESPRRREAPDRRGPMKKNGSKRVPTTAPGKQDAELQRNATRAAELLKAMSNASRLMVLCYLAEGEKSVSELEHAVGLSQSALSQHLARLRREKIVTARRAGQTVYYSLCGKEATAVLNTLYELFCRPQEAAPLRRVTAKAA